jgi:hypothetical protein
MLIAVFTNLDFMYFYFNHSNWEFVLIRCQYLFLSTFYTFFVLIILML